ncbi:immunoglobulin domain-containing protein [Prosthecobacter fusiformis]|nr:immunoglobulin domain-containing protein [Prosthecobacter fusiformis]
MDFKLSLRHCASPLLLACVWGGFLPAQDVPRLSLSQVGLHFICTADGQPDMYSWRHPVKDVRPGSAPEDYLIPEIALEDLDSSLNVSGGRTALSVEPYNGQGFAIAHDVFSGFYGQEEEARLTNGEAVHWTEPGKGENTFKKRYYSNFPPLSGSPVMYGIVSDFSGVVGDSQYGRTRRVHPGYNPYNWNYTLDYNVPLTVNQKRIQAMLYLQLHHAITTDADKNFDFTFVISGADLGSVRVDGQAIFAKASDYVFQSQKALFETADQGTLGGFADSQKIARGRYAQGRPPMPADSGYITNLNSSTSLLLNLNLSSLYWTMNRDEILDFSSELITLAVYSGNLSLSSLSTVQPVQIICFKLPDGRAPAPDLVTVGTYPVHGFNANGLPYHKPCLQAPHWWSFNSDGAIGRPYGSQSNTALRGRYANFSQWNWDKFSVNSSDPFAPQDGYRQRVPGGNSLIYGYDERLYPDVRKVPVAELIADPLKRIEYQAPRYNMPLHFGTDTLRTLSYVHDLTPKLYVEDSDFTPHPSYNDVGVHLAYASAYDPPQIITPPQAQSLQIKGPVSMSVEVSSSTPVTYQWRFNEDPIPNANGPNFEMEMAEKAQEGSYDVVVTNWKESLISESVELIVHDPVIVTDPVSKSVAVGGAVTFSVSAEGADLTYQWRRNHLAIPNAVSKNLELSRLKFTDEGLYDVIVTGRHGQVISQPANLTVFAPLAIVQQPVGGRLRLERSMTLKVNAVGEMPIRYQWWRGSEMIAGAETAELLVTATDEDDAAGFYKVVVTSPQGSVTSKTAEVVGVDYPPVITLHPEDQIVGVGLAASFSVEAEGESLRYQWRRNGVNISRANAASYVIPQVKKTHVGIYDCVISNNEGNTLSRSAELSLPVSLSFTRLPEDQFVTEGENAIFKALVVSEGEKVTYQWSFNGKVILGAIYPELTVHDTSPELAGVYSVEASKGGEKVTASALLKVREPGMLVYKITGTGQTVVGSTNTRVTVTGYLLLEQMPQGLNGALIIVTKDGRYSRYHVQRLDHLRLDSTGPSLKTQSVISSVAEGTEESPFRSLLWLQGADSLIVLSPTVKTLGPKTLSGTANQMSMLRVDGPSKTTLETLSLKAALDITSSAVARQNSESLDGTLERLVVDLQVKGYLEMAEEEP